VPAVLEIPRELARLGVQDEQRSRVEIQTGPRAAEVLVGGVAERDEDEAVLLVDRHRRPHAGAAPVLPAVEAPRAEVRLAGPRHDVEAPQLLAGDQIEAARIARYAITPLLAGSPGEDRDVLVDRGRRADLPRAAELVHDAFGQVHDARGAFDRLTGLRVELHHEAVDRAEHDARRMLGGAPPVRNAAIRDARAIAQARNLAQIR